MKNNNYYNNKPKVNINFINNQNYSDKNLKI